MAIRFHRGIYFNTPGYSLSLLHKRSIFRAEHPDGESSESTPSKGYW